MDLALVSLYFFGGFFVSLFVLWVMYINVMLLKNNYDNIPKPIIYLAAPFAAVGYIGDILFSIIYGTIWFLEWPYFKLDDKDPTRANWHNRLTFTHRLKRILRGQTDIEPEDFRFKTALFICKKMLEPWDPDHCGLQRLDLD